jgi:hypothetical protein
MGETRRRRVCLSMYIKTENIYYSQLSSVAILLQPEPVSHRTIQRKDCVFSLSLCAIVLRSSPPSNVSTCNGQRSSKLFCIHYNVNQIPRLKLLPLWLHSARRSQDVTKKQATTTSFLKIVERSVLIVSFQPVRSVNLCNQYSIVKRMN